MPSLSTSERSTSPAKIERPDLGSLRSAYESADGFCKEVQAFVDNAGIPAINELRYAGHHLLVALANDGSLASQDDLIKAHNHVQRACYEACEAGILFALDRIDSFKEQYKTVVVSQIVPNYHQVLVASHTAMERVKENRASGSDRTQDHSDLISLFRELVGHCKTLDLSRDELNKLAAKPIEDARKDIRDTRRFIITIAVAIFIGIATVAAAGIFAFHHS